MAELGSGNVAGRPQGVQGDTAELTSGLPELLAVPPPGPSPQ